MISKKIKTCKSPSSIFDEGQLIKLPDQSLYQRSFMHRDIISNILVHSDSNTIITTSNDGFIKFWKRSLDTSCIDFLVGFHIYHRSNSPFTFSSHSSSLNSAFLGISMSEDGRYLSTIGTLSSDKIALKLFDVANLDMITMKSLDFIFKKDSKQEINEKEKEIEREEEKSQEMETEKFPISISLVKPKNQRDLEVWITHKDHIFILQKIELTFKMEIKVPFIISQIVNNQDTMIIADSQGKIYYWNIETGKQIEKQEFPKETHLESESFIENLKIFPIIVSNCKRWFAYLASDRQVRIFRFSTGRLYRKYDESLNFYENTKAEERPTDFARRMKLESDLDKHVASFSFQTLNSFNSTSTSTSSSLLNFAPCCCFDDSGEFIFIPSPFGVKIIHLGSNKLVSLIGGKEQNIRIHQIALYQGSPKSTLASSLSTFSSSDGGVNGSDESGSIGPISLEMMTSNNPALDEISKIYPMLICSAWNKQRFYLFTQQPPNKVGQRLDRDVMNEASFSLSKDSNLTLFPIDESGNSINNSSIKRAVIRTNFGDIPITLFPQVAPLAVENFSNLSKRGYYNNLLFHRIIPNFIIQTGDPLNNGTGGTSMWNTKFPDEIVPIVKFDRSFRLAMANSGKDSNASQFFITITKCPWLDGKHTIFGEVAEGEEGESGRETTVEISKQKRDKMDRPLQDIKVIDIVLK